MSALQTYLPEPDFTETAALLHDVHLERQRRDVYLIFEILAGLRDQWRNRPAVQMWRGSEVVLLDYGLKVCREWRARGHNDEIEARLISFVEDVLYAKIWVPGNTGAKPWWLGHPGFHLSHKSNLVREMPDHYGRIWPEVKPGLPFVWPDPMPPSLAA